MKSFQGLKVALLFRKQKKKLKSVSFNKNQPLEHKTSCSHRNIHLLSEVQISRHYDNVYESQSILLESCDSCHTAQSLSRFFSAWSAAIVGLFNLPAAYVPQGETHASAASPAGSISTFA